MTSGNSWGGLHEGLKLWISRDGPEPALSGRLTECVIIDDMHTVTGCSCSAHVIAVADVLGFSRGPGGASLS